MAELFFSVQGQIKTIDNLTAQLLRTSPSNMLSYYYIYGQIGTDGRIFIANDSNGIYEISIDLQTKTEIVFNVPHGDPLYAINNIAIYGQENLLGISTSTIGPDYHGLAWNIEDNGIDSDLLSQWTTTNYYNSSFQDGDESNAESMATWNTYAYYTTEAAVVRQINYNTGVVNNIIYLNENPLYQEYTVGKRDVDLQGVAISKVRNNLYAFGYDQQTNNQAYVFKAPLGTTGQWDEVISFQSDFFSSSFSGTASIIEPYLYMAPNNIVQLNNNWFTVISRLNLDTLEFIEQFYKIQSLYPCWLFGFADGTWNPSSGWHVGYIT